MSAVTRVPTPPRRTATAALAPRGTAAAATAPRSTAPASRSTAAPSRDAVEAPRPKAKDTAPAAADAAWTRLERALLAHPTESLADVGARVGLSARAVEAAIAGHGGPQATWKRRDLAAAEALAKVASANPDVSSFRELARLAQDVLPGLLDYHIPKLKGRHPELLAHLEARAMSAPLPPAVRARIAELALAHPTLDYGALARLFARDPALRGVLKWTEAEVSRLREPSRILPSERKREAALAELAAQHLSNAEGPLDAALATLAQAHPGVDKARLVELGAHHPALAQALWRLEHGTEASAAPSRARGAGGRTPTALPAPIAIDAALARKLDLGGAVLERALGASTGGLVAEVHAALTELEHTLGNGDGVLTPRELAGAPPPLDAIMARVHQALGKKAHPLADVRAALPAAIAELAEQSRRRTGGDSLHQRATAEAVTQLAAAYRAEVIEGGGTPLAFHGGQKIVSRVWQRIRDALPEHFPTPSAAPPTAERLAAVAELYTQLLAGELSTGGFYARAGITAPELRLLQASDPARFPRPEGTPSWRTVAGRRDAKALDVPALARAYREVTAGQVSLPSFLETHGLSKHRLAALRAEHPRQFPGIGRWADKTPDVVLAQALGQHAKKAIDADVLRDVPEILSAANADPALVDLFGGPINRSRYEALRSKFPHEFPELRRPELFLPVLADEVRQILIEEPTLTPVGITARMRERHPSFRLSRVYQLREAFPDLMPSDKPRPAVDRASDARLLAARMKAAPGKSLPALAEELSALSPRFTKEYLHRLRKSFPAAFDAPGLEVRTRPIARESATVGQLYALTVRLCPPGTTEAELARGLDTLLEARGLPPFGGTKPTSGPSKAMAATHGTLEAQNARVVAEVVAEYATAAPRGTTEAELFAAVLADYPSLDKQKLTTYRNLWRASPPPALAGFVKRGQLELVGRGRAVESPRYLGGWDVERALLTPAQADPALATSLAKLSSHARIPLSLPLLDKVIDSLEGRTPLMHKNVLWVTHVLASTYALSVALRQAGAAAARTVVVGTPYGTNSTAREALAGDGFDVRKPALDTTAYRAEVQAAVDAIVAKHRENHQPVVVLDDGGLVAEILRSDPKYADVRGAFKIVEQTTRGITAAEQDTVDMPVINVARSDAKVAEGALIGRAVAAKVVQGLERVGKQLEGARATVVGYGTIGARIADELRLRGAEVTVVEPSVSRARQAKKDGYTVATKAEAFPKSQVVIGATGHTSIELADLKRLPSGAAVASASSKRLELEMTALEAAASSTRTIEPGSPLVTLPTRAYQLGSRELTIIGDGWPVNFDGDVEDIPAEEIQLTRAVMLAGAIQAASLKPHRTSSKGVIPLDPDLDKLVLEGFRALMKGRKSKPPIGDPSRWAEVLRTTAAELESALAR